MIVTRDCETPLRVKSGRRQASSAMSALPACSHTRIGREFDPQHLIGSVLYKIDVSVNALDDTPHAYGVLRNDDPGSDQ